MSWHHRRQPRKTSTSPKRSQRATRRSPRFDLTKATAAYQAALKLDPKSYEANWKLARALADQSHARHERSRRTEETVRQQAERLRARSRATESHRLQRPHLSRHRSRKTRPLSRRQAEGRTVQGSQDGGRKGHRAESKGGPRVSRPRHLEPRDGRVELGAEEVRRVTLRKIPARLAGAGELPTCARRPSLRPTSSHITSSWASRWPTPATGPKPTRNWSTPSPCRKPGRPTTTTRRWRKRNWRR